MPKFARNIHFSLPRCDMLIIPLRVERGGSIKPQLLSFQQTLLICVHESSLKVSHGTSIINLSFNYSQIITYHTNTHIYFITAHETFAA